MKVKVSLAIYNGKGSMASLEEFDEMGGSLNIAGGVSVSAKRAEFDPPCRKTI